MKCKQPISELGFGNDYLIHILSHRILPVHWHCKDQLVYRTNVAKLAQIKSIQPWLPANVHGLELQFTETVLKI